MKKYNLILSVLVFSAVVLGFTLPEPQQKKVMQEYQGTVDFYDDEKGYGIINPEGGDEFLYFNESDLKSEVKEGDCVTFDIETDDQQEENDDYAVNVALCE